MPSLPSPPPGGPASPSLPAPGALPLLGWILVVVTLACLWLIERGLHPAAALAVVAGIGLVAVEIEARFSGVPARWLPRLAAQVAQP